MSTDEQIALLQRNFDEVARQDGMSGVEFWYARDLQSLLGYAQWRNFSEVVEKAKIACRTAGVVVANHFADVSKMVDLGSGAKREIADVMLTRYACYLIAQNGDPRKEQIAFAQSYFAVQTRRQELIRDRMNLLARLDARERLKEAEKRLSQNIYERGVDDDGFARIRSKGDAALFGGNTTAVMKNKFGMPENRPLADFLPTLTIAAKNLATEITNHNVEANDLRGESPITREHVQNNLGVREMLNARGIVPENLPPAEDIKKLERRVRNEEKRLAQNSKLQRNEENL